MKIKRYQTGGIVYTPFIPNRAEQAQGSSGPAQTEKISGTFTKEVIDILKENGIPNDVDAFLQEADSFLNRSSNLSQFSIFGGDQEEHNLSDVIRVHSLANRVKFNKQLYDQASTQLTKERAWSEVATDNKGNMYVYSEDGGVELISPSEYHKNRENYTALTNHQLISLRESQPGLAYEQNILNNMTGSVGMESITNYVKGVIKDFGTSQLDGYVEKSRGKIENGLQELMMGGSEGYYKYSQKSQVDKDNKDDIDYALEYLYSVLPENMKSLLRAKSAAEGMDPKSRIANQQLLAMALMEHTSESRGVDFDNAATSSAGGGKSEQTVDQHYLEVGRTGGFNPIIPEVISPTNSEVKLIAMGQDLGPFVTQNMKSMSSSNLATLLGDVEGKEGALMLQLGDKNSISFGDTLVSSQDWHKVVWDGESNMKRVTLPAKNINGRIVPDFDLQQTINQFSSFITDNDLSPIDIRERINNNNAMAGKVEYVGKNERGEPVLRALNSTEFITFSAYASDDQLGFNTRSQYLHKIPRSEGKTIMDKYDNIMRYNQVIPAKNSVQNPNTSGSSTNRWDLYQGNVFIALGGPATGTLLGNTQKVSKQLYTVGPSGDIQNRVQANENEKQIIRQFK